MWNFRIRKQKNGNGECPPPFSIISVLAETARAMLKASDSCFVGTDKDGGFVASLRVNLIAARAQILNGIRYRHSSSGLFGPFEILAYLDAVCFKIQDLLGCTWSADGSRS